LYDKWIHENSSTSKEKEEEIKFKRGNMVQEELLVLSAGRRTPYKTLV
jgi:hypothetical protein